MKKEDPLKTWKDYFYAIIGFSFCAAVIYGSYKFIELIIDSFNKLVDENVDMAVAIIAGLLAILSVVIGQVISNTYNSRMKRIDETRKINIGFSDWIIKVLLSKDEKRRANLLLTLEEKQNEVVINASPKVIKKWSQVRTAAIKDSEVRVRLSEEEYNKYYVTVIMPLIEELLLVLRKEIGLSNNGLKKYDLIRLYVNDIDKYINVEQKI